MARVTPPVWPSLAKPLFIIDSHKFERQRKGRQNQIIQLYGEHHSPQNRQPLGTADNLRQFLEQQLEDNPRAHLYIEQKPEHFGKKFQNPAQGILGKVSTDLSRSPYSKAGRVHFVDVRDSPEYFPPEFKWLAKGKSPTPITGMDIIRARQFIRDSVSPIYKEYPHFEQVVENDLRHKIPEGVFSSPLTPNTDETKVQLGKFKAPLMDAEFLNSINLHKDRDMILYAGDAHRRNVEETLMNTPKFIDKGKGLVFLNPKKNIHSTLSHKGKI